MTKSCKIQKKLTKSCKRAFLSIFPHNFSTFWECATHKMVATPLRTEQIPRMTKKMPRRCVFLILRNDKSKNFLILRNKYFQFTCICQKKAVPLWSRSEKPPCKPFRHSRRTVTCQSQINVTHKITIKSTELCQV